MTNLWILRLTGVAVVPTRTPETRTGRAAREVPTSVTNAIAPFVPIFCHWNVLFGVALPPDGT